VKMPTNIPTHHPIAPPTVVATIQIIAFIRASPV
jgi:hypothetical protein